MRGVNVVILMGNMTRDAELRYTPNGRAVADFGLAVNRTYKDASGEVKEAVDFFDVVVWGKLAEIIGEYGGKGKGVHVVGRLQNRSWEGQDGSKRNKTEVIANEITLVGAKGGDSSASYSEAAPSKSTGSKKSTVNDSIPEEEIINIDDIPF